MNKKKKRMYLRISSIMVLFYIFMVACLPVILLVQGPKHVSAKTISNEEIVISSMSIDPATIVEPIGDVSPPSEPTITQIPTPTTTPEPTITPTPTSVPENKMSKYSEKDIALLQRVTMSESGNQPLKTKVAVAQTIINRVNSGKYGDTISDVVYAKYQYSTTNNGEPNKEVISAVEEAINNTPYPNNMYYFRQSHYHTWAIDYKQIGDLYFSLGT